MISNGQTLSGLRMFVESVSMDRFYCALYGDKADLGPLTPRYTTIGEVSGPGYTAGGKALTEANVVMNNDAVILDFQDPVWPNSTISARGALIYNRSCDDCAVTVMDFGELVTSKNGNFRLPFPAPTDSEGLIRLVLKR